MSYLSHADLGGQIGHGPIVQDVAEPLFHHDWERRALAITLAMGATGAWNIDMSRAARETRPNYAAMSYYEIWISALETLLLERGLVSADELAAGRALAPAQTLPRRLAAADVAGALRAGSPTARAATEAACFTVGQRVRMSDQRAAHHTRLPAYARGRHGIVQHVHGKHVFADTHAQGLGEQPQWLYTVVFDGADLWGDGGAPGLQVSVDAWQPYLEAV